MHRLLVSAAHKSSGKTTVTLGLAAALAEQGVAVQPFKKGPDYIDPMWLSLAAGRPCLNLDPHLMEAASIERLFAQGMDGATLGLVEGNHGLYDGLALDGSNSNAALAHLLQLPVLLVIDVRGMTRGLAPLLLGYQAFDRALRIGGVILNRVGGSRHESRLRAVVERYTDLPVLGAVAEDPRLGVVERHLGLVTTAEAGDAVERVRRIGHIIGSQVDLARVRELASQAGPWSPSCAPSRASSPAPEAASAPRLRLGIARDRAFGFYYPDDLQALQAAGADLVPFDTLHDTRLPAVDALFIGGGFPETCLDALEANASMRQSIREALQAGMPAYAECGGLMYLSRAIRWGDRRVEMVGVVPGEAVMHARPVGRGYVALQATAQMPWPGGWPSTVHAHEFHHSRLEGLDDSVEFAWRVQRGYGVDGQHDGVRIHNLLASYAHLRDVAGTGWAARFVEFALQQRSRPSATQVQAPAVAALRPGAAP